MMASSRIERELLAPGRPVRSGVMVAVVGASGVGKDTLIKGARRQFSEHEDVLFVKRVITRPADAVGENHRSVSLEHFERVEAEGGFAVSWHAHGLGYGVPIDVDTHVGRGGVAIVNGSRAALAVMAKRYQHLVIVNVTADRDTLARRLAARGRESHDQILARLARTETCAFDHHLENAVKIDNSGPVAQAVAALVGEIRKALAFTAVSDVI